MKTLNHNVAVIVLAAVAAGCGSDDTPARSSVPELDACKLLTAADAGAVLGAPAVEPEFYTRLNSVDEQLGTAMSNCIYARDGGFETLSVVVNYRRSENPASFDALRAANEAAGGAMAEITRELLDDSEPVDGLGDFAYWTADAGTLTVYAQRHYEIAITADGAAPGDTASARVRATNVARKILERL